MAQSPIQQKSIERLKDLKKVLDRMIKSNIIWTKAQVCKELGISAQYLSERSAKKWHAAKQAIAMYKDACEEIRANNPNLKSKLIAKDFARTRFLEDELKDVTAYNKKLGLIIRQLKAENDRLRAELERVNGEHQKAS